MSAMEKIYETDLETAEMIVESILQDEVENVKINHFDNMVGGISNIHPCD